MIADISTIIWKEVRENIINRQGIRGGWANILLIIFIMGVFIPWQTGPAWLSDSQQLLIWLWIPIFLALSHVTDTFAGERERRTLETLLSTRLSDQAILFGKLAWVVLYAWLITVASLLLGALTINIAFPADTLQFYPLKNLVIGVGISFLSALLISCLGVLVSLKAATARQAYQRLSLIFIAVWFIPLIALQFLPKTLLEQISGWILGLNLTAVIVCVILGLLILDGFLVLIVKSSFRRARLILS